MTDTYWDHFIPELVNQAHLNQCPGCRRCQWITNPIEKGPRTCCGAATRCTNCCKEPGMKFEDGHNTGTVGADPWDGRVVLEWADDEITQTRVSLSPDVAEAYANAVLAAVEEARK